jgi:hypothetical protein
VHYHPSKANVVANALSQKSHCNSFVSEDFHLSHLLHPVVLHNITVDCSLRSQIIELQKTDVGVFHIKRKMKEQETKHFEVDDKGILWFNDRLVVPKNLETKSWLKLTLPSYLSILVVVKCIKISSLTIGGPR